MRNVVQLSGEDNSATMPQAFNRHFTNDTQEANKTWKTSQSLVPNVCPLAGTVHR